MTRAAMIRLPSQLEQAHIRRLKGCRDMKRSIILLIEQVRPIET